MTKNFLSFLLLVGISLVIFSPMIVTSIPNKHEKKCVRDKIGVITEQPKNLKVPNEIAVPAHNVFKFALDVVGISNWTCAAYPNGTTFWNTTYVESFLINDRNNFQLDGNCIIGRHYFTDFPLNGGFAVYQSLVPGDDSILYERPLIRYNSPDGAFSDITYALRLKTKGGNPPSSAKCGVNYKKGDVISVRYYSENWFFKKA
ncbi:11086_t:CDS:2 [Acaulospora morrowiae]|uniref:11086_t:CDS:1 n=1 Tax=Acaulospora morrowiae TaxID=94023 RepID=A0A9N9CPI0_9GLOM|nr:11086_t:CDS:2 [Acaulospora morrowiae]